MARLWRDGPAIHKPLCVQEDLEQIQPALIVRGASDLMLRGFVVVWHAEVPAKAQ